MARNVIKLLMDEAKDRLVAEEQFRGKVATAYNEESLIEVLKGIKGYPAIGVVYEGMQSIAEPGPTSRVGISAEIVIALIVVQQGEAIHGTLQRQDVALDTLAQMRDVFLGQRSTVTQHYWKFVVEAPAELKKNWVCWVQRWSVPAQLSPTRPPS